jgi:hypothetical protein
MNAHKFRSWLPGTLAGTGRRLPMNGSSRRVCLLVAAAILSNLLVAEVRADLSDGLVAYWSFDEGSGAIAHDSSGNGNHGTISGATWAQGVSGAALDFDGLDDCVEVPDHPPLRLSGTDFSISAWLYLRTRDEDYADAIAAKRSDGSHNGWIWGTRGLRVPSETGKVMYQVSGGADPRVLSAGTVGLDAWHHVVLTYDYGTSSLDIYIDGAHDTSGSVWTPNAETNASLFIGRDSQSCKYCIDGILDDIRIYDCALTAQEVHSLYVSTPEPGSLMLLALGAALLAARRS